MAPRAHGPGAAILTWGWNIPGTARVPDRLVSFGQALLSGMLKSTEMDGIVFAPELVAGSGDLCGDPAASLGGD